MRTLPPAVTEELCQRYEVALTHHSTPSAMATVELDASSSIFSNPTSVALVMTTRSILHTLRGRLRTRFIRRELSFAAHGTDCDPEEDLNHTEKLRDGRQNHLRV